MKQLFPIRHVMGYVFSLVLTVVAMVVLLPDFQMSHGVEIAILIITAAVQTSVQLFLFMHIDEDKSSKSSLYTNIAYALFVALVTVFGTLFTMIWGYL
ncbi:cytochrome aa3 quinol oxidase subunit IV [Paenibacillus marinisediminis]